MIKDFIDNKLSKYIDYLFVFYIILLFCFDANEFGVNLVQIFMYIMIVLLLINIYKQKKIIYNTSLILFGVFVAFCALTSVFAIDVNTSIMKSINLLVKLVFVFLLYNNYHDKRGQSFLLKSFIFGGTILCLYLMKNFGVIKFFQYTFTGQRIYAGVPNMNILSGLSNINTISVILSFSLIFCLYYLFEKKWIYLIPAIIISFGIIGGGSKTALLLIVVSFVYLFIKSNVLSSVKNKKRFYIVLSCSLLIFALLVAFSPVGARIQNMFGEISGTKKDVSTSERLTLFSEGFNVFLDNPIYGIGLENSRIVVNSLIGSPTFFHSDFIELLACTGLIGFGLYLLSHIYLWKDRKTLKGVDITQLILICFVVLLPICCDYAMKYRFILFLIALSGVKYKEIIIPDKVIEKIGKIFDWRTYIYFLKYHGLLNFLSDKTYLSILFAAKFNRKIDLDNPKTFNEKLQWLKINDHDEKYINLVDKHEVKEIVANKIGDKYVIPSYGVYDSFDEIDFKKLPKQFVIKCTHDSGGVVVCDDKRKLNIKAAREKIEKHLKINYYYSGREWPYKKVVPRIIVEKFMEDNNNKEMIDYKVMCFDGKPKMIFTCTERFTDGLKVTFFDLEWNKLPFERHYPTSSVKIKKPKNLDKMLELSKKLSQGLKFVRIDWYEINGELYFGEYTLYPGSGFEEFTPEEWDYKIGDMIKLK